MAATMYRVGYLAGEIHSAYIERRNLPLDQAPLDCAFQFASGYRCAFESQHKYDEHVAIRRDRDRGAYVVCDVAPVEVRLADLDEAIEFVTAVTERNGELVSQVEVTLMRAVDWVPVNRHNTVCVRVSFDVADFELACRGADLLNELMTRMYRVAESVVDGPACTVHVRPSRFV